MNAWPSGMKNLSIRNRLIVGMMTVIVIFGSFAALTVWNVLKGYARKESRQGMELAGKAYVRYSRTQDQRLAERAEAYLRDVSLESPPDGVGSAPSPFRLEFFGRLQKEPFYVLAHFEKGVLLDSVGREFDEQRLQALPGISRLREGSKIRQVWEYGSRHYQVVALPLVVEGRTVGFLALGNALGAETAETMVDVSGHDVLLVQGGKLLGFGTVKEVDPVQRERMARSLFEALPARFGESPGGRGPFMRILRDFRGLLGLTPEDPAEEQFNEEQFQEKQFHTATLEQGDFLLYRVPMDAKNTDLVLVRSLSAAQAHLTRGIHRILLWVLVVVLLALFVSHVISAQLTDPISELSRAASALARGNLKTEVAVVRDDEVGRLGATFNRMAREIQIRREEVRKRGQASEQASETKSAFLANMSHELRTPLNGIIGFAGIVLEDELSPTQRENVGLIKRSGDDLLTIINDLLDFSKIEAGQMELDNSEMDLRALLHRCADPLLPGIKEKGLVLEFDVDERLPRRMIGPPARLQQIVRNYLSNAFKFTDEGVLSLKATLADEGSDDLLVRIEVRDTGRGIRADRLGKLFRPFSQIDPGGAVGTGLGLAICKELAELMGGTTGAESQVGVGSSFWFTARLEKIAPLGMDRAPAALPRANRTAGTKTIEVSEAEREQRASRRILVVEDHPVNQRMVKIILDRSGWPHEIVADGEEALARYRAGEFDAILMDCQMPLLDGYETTRRLREREKEAGDDRVPVIALTANTMSGDRDRCMEAGMDDFIGKPIRAGELVEKLERWLGRPSQA